MLLKSHQKSLAGDTWLKNYSEQINKIPEAKKSKAVKLKPSSILMKNFIFCEVLGVIFIFHYPSCIIFITIILLRLLYYQEIPK